MSDLCVFGNGGQISRNLAQPQPSVCPLTFDRNANFENRVISGIVGDNKRSKEIVYANPILEVLEADNFGLSNTLVQDPKKRCQLDSERHIYQFF